MSYESYKTVPFNVKILINIFQPSLGIQFDNETNENRNQAGDNLRGHLKNMIQNQYQALHVNQKRKDTNMEESTIWGMESSIIESQPKILIQARKPSRQLARQPGDTSIYQSIGRLAPTSIGLSYNQAISDFISVLYTGNSIGMNPLKKVSQEDENIIERAILNIPSNNMNEHLPDIIAQEDFMNAPYFIKERGQIIEKKIPQQFNNPLWQQGNREIYQEVLKVKNHRMFLDNLLNDLELGRKVNIFVFKENNIVRALQNLNSLIQDNNGLYQKMRNSVNHSGSDPFEKACHKVANLLGNELYLEKINLLEQEDRRQESQRQQSEQNRLQQEQAAQNHLMALQAKAQPTIDYENLPLEIKTILTHARNKEVLIERERTTLEADKFSQTFQDLVIRVLTEMPNTKGNAIIGVHNQPTEVFSSLSNKEKFFLLKIMDKKNFLVNGKTYWNSIGDGGNWKTQISTFLNQAKK